MSGARNMTLLSPRDVVPTVADERELVAAGAALIESTVGAVADVLRDTQWFFREEASANRPIAIPRRFSKPWLPCTHQHVQTLHRRWLAKYARATAVADVLDAVLNPRGSQQINQLDASEMLKFLFAATGKRRGDDAAAKLMACANIFSAMHAAMGELMDWEPVPTHPLMLAMAIHELMAQQVFEPSEAELRKALAKMMQILRAKRHAIEHWQSECEIVDELMFSADRATWQAAWLAKSVGVDCVELMQSHEDGPSDEEEDWHASERWLALEAVRKAKAGLHDVKPDARAAACERKPEKRTRKLKSRED